MLKGALIDLSGVVYSGAARLPGAKRALARLDEAGLPYRFVTNTTSKPVSALVAQLGALGLDAPADHIFAPARAASAWLSDKGFAPHLLVHPRLEEDFAGTPRTGPPAVVLGDAREHFTFDRLNAAFRLLIDGAPLVALARNRTFKDDDGRLSLDIGAYVTALEYSAGVEAHVMGKPARAFFAAAAESMGLDLGEVAMIGDDAEADVAGALDAGAAMGLLVRTGKYREGDEKGAGLPASAVVDDIGAAVDALLTEIR